MMPVTKFNLSSQNPRNRDILAFINEMLKCYSYSFTGNTTATNISAVNTPAPLAIPSSTPVEVQQGTHWLHQTTNSTPEWVYSGESQLSELHLTITMRKASLPTSAEVELQFRKDGAYVAGWFINVNKVSVEATTTFSGCLYLPLINSGVYSIWLVNHTDADDIIIDNIRCSARPIPNLYPE